MTKNKKDIQRQVIELFLKSSKTHRIDINVTAKLFCIQLLKKIGEVDFKNKNTSIPYLPTFLDADGEGSFLCSESIFKVKLIGDTIYITIECLEDLKETLKDVSANRYAIDYLVLLEFLLNYSIVNGIDIEN